MTSLTRWAPITLTGLDEESDRCRGHASSHVWRGVTDWNCEWRCMLYGRETRPRRPRRKCTTVHAFSGQRLSAFFFSYMYRGLWVMSCLGQVSYTPIHVLASGDVMAVHVTCCTCCTTCTCTVLFCSAGTVVSRRRTKCLGTWTHGIAIGIWE